ncbi:aspartate/glutamate racemase family protein [Siculibacillus lacustris]|uniref:Aspartate/glutamate racemase family protein n=1 Tax=Siculibacillus lacustris TaxID=1549641 RepID=A0A4Q9VIN2_9HYPH|nr:aspartate/glutamate racemase family protein [Siculibacillus lacustris]TBW34604.1 aspartate/glutamate racemase family protein [Siculibacillus lacustris]
MSEIIGLIGGMSWESTATYYKAINEIVRARRGGLASAEILLHSVDFESIVALQKAGDWDGAADRLADIGRRLAGAGAGCVLICTNTMHLVADRVAAALDVPLIHIVDVTGAALVAAGRRRPLLLATRYTMEHGFYLDRLKARFPLDPIVPDAADRGRIHDVIFDELCCGTVRAASRAAYVEIIEKGRAAGADSVILGCTEIGLLIGQEHSALPIYDSTLLHAAAAVAFAEGDAGLASAA